MSALLAARLPGPTTSASISADELNAVLARIRARCRPDLAVSAAQRLEALLGVAEASRAELRAARSGATGWLGLGSVAFVGSVDWAEAEAGRASEAVSFGAAALRSYADVAQTCLDRCWGLEHQLLVAYDERSRGLAAEATAESVPPAGRGADQLFDSVTGDLLRAARLLLEEVEAAIAALMARLSRLAVGSALPGDIALGLGPDAISLGCPRGGLSDWWGVGKEIRTGVGSAMTLWTGAKALSMFAAYARAQQGVAQGLAATRYLASLQPFLGALGRASLPVTVIGDLKQVIDPSHPGARGWGDRAAGLVGAGGAATLLLTSAGLIALGPVGAAVAVGGLVVAGAWQLGSLIYDHRKEIGDALSSAWHGVEEAGGVVVDAAEQLGGAALDTAEQLGGAALDTAEQLGGAALDTAEQLGGAAKHGLASAVDWLT